MNVLALIILSINILPQTIIVYTIKHLLNIMFSNLQLNSKHITFNELKTRDERNNMIPTNDNSNMRRHFGSEFCAFDYEMFS